MNSGIPLEDFLDFKCPYCGTLNSFPTSAAGLVRGCMNCLDDFLVPTADGQNARRLPLPIETPSIRLRRFESTDWKQLLEFQFEEEDEATGWLITNSKARLTEVHQIFSLAIETRENNKLIGTLGLWFSDIAFNQMELSFSFREATPQDLQLEAFDAALAFCFQELKLHRVVVRSSTKFPDSLQLFKEAGMRREGECLEDHFLDGQWLSTVFFAMLEEEYFADPP